MMRFGLASSTFSDPAWRPATFADVQEQGNKLMSSLGLEFLQDVSVSNYCLHIGVAYLVKEMPNGSCRTPNGSCLYPTIQAKLWRVGQKPAIENDMVASCLTTRTDDEPRTADGYAHLFVSASVKKRKIGCDKSLGEFLWKERSFPDAVVTCGDSRFEVHRAVLAQNLVFKRCLGGAMVEARTATFDIQGSHAEAVEALLRHIYTKDTDVPQHVLVPLLDLAVQYEEPDLVAAVASALTDVSLETVRAHGCALKFHREHPDVTDAYSEFLANICKKPDLVASLI